MNLYVSTVAALLKKSANGEPSISIYWHYLGPHKTDKESQIIRCPAQIRLKDIHFVVPNLGPPTFAPSQTDRTFLFSLVTIQPFEVFLTVYIGHISYFTNILVLKNLPVPPKQPHPPPPRANTQFKLTGSVPFLLGCR
jgi:hypothetical protein